MAPQIRIAAETKLSLDKLDMAHWVKLKTYDQKIGYLLWLYNESKDSLESKAQQN